MHTKHGFGDLTITNTLAYHSKIKITKVEGFIAQA
jgi:hypothetical protein